MSEESPMNDLVRRARAALENAAPAPWTNCAIERHPTSDSYIVDAEHRAVAGSIMPDVGPRGVAYPNGYLVSLSPELATAVVRIDEVSDALDEEAVDAFELGNTVQETRAATLAYAAECIRAAFAPVVENPPET